MTPAGIIIIWSGSIATIPPGWQYCDGSNGTLDLRAKFIPCIGQRFEYHDNSSTGAHLHTIDDGSHNHELKGGTGLGFGAPVSGNSSSENVEADTDPKNHYPPYYALAYIQKL